MERAAQGDFLAVPSSITNRHSTDSLATLDVEREKSPSPIIFVSEEASVDHLDAYDNDNIDVEVSQGQRLIQTAALIKILGRYSNQCEDIITEGLASEMVYPQEILTNILHAVSKIKEISIEIENGCKTTLEHIKKKKLEIGDIQRNDDLSLLLDPADRPKDLTDLQKEKLIELGPYQPKLKTYPDNPDVPGRKQCRFVYGWFKDYPHLEYSIKSDKVSCFVCCLFPTGPGREKASNAWIDGLRCWERTKSVGKDKKGRLALHFSSEAHKAALADLVHFADSVKHIDVLLNKELSAAKIQEEEDNFRNQEIIKIILDITRTLSRQQIAFRGSKDDSDGNFIQIAKLVARHNAQLSFWLSEERMKPYSIKYLSSASQNEFIDILAEDVRDRVVNEVKEARMHSVMADTSPDTANTDRLVVAVRYVNTDNEPRERVIEMKETRDKDGKGQAKDILTSLISNGLSRDELAFQSYDYTASMSGIFKGAQKCLQDEVGRNVPYIPCQGHRSNTFIEHCSKTQLFSSMYDILQELYVFFSKSCKRDIVLRKHLETVENALKLRNLSKTRWCYRSESIEAVWRSFEAIQNALQAVSSLGRVEANVRNKALALHTNMCKFDFVFALMFMRLVMKKTKLLTLEMQKEELNILDALTLVEETVKILESMRECTYDIDNEVCACIQFCKNTLKTDPEDEYARIHRPRKMPRRYDENQDTEASLSINVYYRKAVREVLDSLIHEYTENVKECLERILPLAKLLQPPFAKPSIEDMSAVAQLVPPSLSIDIACLEMEYDIFVNRVNSQKVPYESVHQVCQYAFANKRIFPMMYRLFKLLFTAPVSVAKNERTFSKMKIVKGFLRSTMGDERSDR